MSKESKSSRVECVKFSKAKFIEAVKGSRGIISEIANRMGCSRSTVYKNIKKYEELKELIQEEKDLFGDECEAAAIELVRDKHPSTIMFMLKTRFKDRGYSDKADTSDASEVTININRNIVEREDDDER